MAEDTTVNSEKSPNLDWVAVYEDKLSMASLPPAETTKAKLFRKVRENPLVPLGCTATVCALSYGLYNFYKGRKQMSQYMMRARVLAQAFTFVAILAGMSMAAKKQKPS